MNRVLPVARKEFRELRRDPITLWIALFLPVVLLFVFGYAIRLEVEDVPLAVLDRDHTAASARFIDGLVNTGDFRIRARPADEADMAALLDRGAVRVAVHIPEGFGADLERGRTARVQTIIDGSYSATATILRNEVDAATLAFSMAEARRSGGAAAGTGTGTPADRYAAPAAAAVGMIQPEPRVLYNQALRSETFVVSGLFAVILMALPPLLTVLAVVREKESGSVQQIYVSPLRPWEFIAGKMAAYVLIALFELATIMALGLWWFDVPFRGSPILLIGGSLLFALCTVGIGLLVSTLTESQVVAVLVALIITVMPSFLFSGFMFPISSMAEPIQWYTRIFPAQYFVEVSRGLFLKGVGARVLFDELSILALYTAGVFGLAALRFRKKLA
jgi:ABC-2 type transport system permease protein